MDEDFLDEAMPLEDGQFDSDAEVICPHCGEMVTIVLDPSGGARQEYVEDCEVCCQPWSVRVHYGAGGVATVTLEPS